MNKPIDFETAVALKGIYRENTLQKYCINGVLTIIDTNNTLPAPTYLELLDWLSKRDCFVSVLPIGTEYYFFVMYATHNNHIKELQSDDLYKDWQECFKEGISLLTKLYTDYIRKERL